jgi:hypothetical protein
VKVSILVLKGDKPLRDLFKLFLNLDDFVNVPQYPGYQLLEAGLEMAKIKFR